MQNVIKHMKRDAKPQWFWSLLLVVITGKYSLIGEAVNGLFGDLTIGGVRLEIDRRIDLTIGILSNLRIFKALLGTSVIIENKG